MNRLAIAAVAVTSFEVLGSNAYVRALIGRTTKGTVKIEVTESKCYTNEKSGGSWEEFTAVEITHHANDVDVFTFVECALPAVNESGTRGPHAFLIHGTITMLPDVALVVHSHFCGKDLGKRIYLHPDSPLVAVLQTGVKTEQTHCTYGHEDCVAHPEIAAACAERESKRDRGILTVFKSIKSRHRTEYLARWRFTDADRDRLARVGWIKVNKAGAVQITPEGRIFAGNADYTPRDYFRGEVDRGELPEVDGFAAIVKPDRAPEDEATRDLPRGVS